MKLKLLRTKLLPDRTIGQLYIDEVLFCFTLEDKVREVVGKAVDSWKIKGETAVPSGSYDISLETSPRFGPDTITILRVPGFSGVRIHGGNKPADTEGCPLVGYKLAGTGATTCLAPGTSQPALLDLKRKLKAALAEGQKISLVIQTPGLLVAV